MDINRKTIIIIGLVVYSLIGIIFGTMTAVGLAFHQTHGYSTMQGWLLIVFVGLTWPIWLVAGWYYNVF